MCYGLDHCRCNNRITLSFKKVQHIPPFNSDLVTLGKLNHTNLKHPEALNHALTETMLSIVKVGWFTYSRHYEVLSLNAM